VRRNSQVQSRVARGSPCLTNDRCMKERQNSQKTIESDFGFASLSTSIVWEGHTAKCEKERQLRSVRRGAAVMDQNTLIAVSDTLIDQVTANFWLFPIGSLPVYVAFVRNNMGMDRVAWLLSASLPGITLLPTFAAVALTHPIGLGFLRLNLTIFPAMWVLPAVFIWQLVDLLRGKRTRVGIASGVFCALLVALYAFTSITYFILENMRSP
jgi:hypothetical protein